MASNNSNNSNRLTVDTAQAREDGQHEVRDRK